MTLPTTPKKVYFVTLGCPKNQVDTEVMARLALKSGCEITKNPEEADIITVNTCAFLQASQEESIETILDVARFRKEGSCKKLVVTGCLPSRHPDDVKKSFGEVDHFLGTGDLHRFTELLEADKKTFKSSIHPIKESNLSEEVLGDRFYEEGTFSRYLKIAEGCDRRCSFCIIPKIRGDQKSRTIESLVVEARTLVTQGAREINLIAQDLTAYGHDLPKRKRLEDLLEVLVNDVRDLKWLRLHYAYPQRISPELIALMAQDNAILPYLDMPIQHISTSVLKRMNRGTPGEKLKELLYNLRAKISNIAFRTTFIVGFPGETDEEFEELLRFVEEFEFDNLGAFRYSAEPGTPAGEMPDQIADEVKHQRYDELMALQQQIARKKNKSHIGKTYDVLVTGKSDESEFLVEGRTAFQAPEIDGVVYLTDLGKHPEKVQAGSMVRVKIKKSHDYDLAGVVVSE